MRLDIPSSKQIHPPSSLCSHSSSIICTQLESHPSFFSFMALALALVVVRKWLAELQRAMPCVCTVPKSVWCFWVPTAHCGLRSENGDAKKHAVVKVKASQTSNAGDPSGCNLATTLPSPPCTEYFGGSALQSFRFNDASSQLSVYSILQAARNPLIYRYGKQSFRLFWLQIGLARGALRHSFSLG